MTDLTNEQFDLYTQMEIELRNLVEIYKDDPRDRADIDQPDCIKYAMSVLNRVCKLRGDPKEYHVP